MSERTQKLKSIVRFALKDKTQHTLVQFFRYCFVGGLAAAVDTGLVVFFTTSARLHYTGSVVVGFLAGILINYALSSVWVFNRGLSAVPRRQHLVDLGLFVLIGVTGLLFTLLIVWALFDLLDFPILPAKLFAVAAVLFWNFGARKHFIFRFSENTI